jgi:hypothetical protein
MAEVDKYFLGRHITNVCENMLNSDRIKHCGVCPFEDVILEVRSELASKFKHKRRMIDDELIARRSQLEFDVDNNA